MNSSIILFSNTLTSKGSWRNALSYPTAEILEASLEQSVGGNEQIITALNPSYSSVTGILLKTYSEFD
jgi:hypothetical protein